MIFGMISDCLTMPPARQPFWHLTTVRFWRLIAGMIEHPNGLYALFVLCRPAKDPKTEQESLLWEDFWLNLGAHDAEHNIKEQRLAENIWLIPLKDGLPILGRLVKGAKTAGLPYRILYFDGEPNWVVSEHELKIRPHDVAFPSQPTP